MYYTDFNMSNQAIELPVRESNRITDDELARDLKSGTSFLSQRSPKDREKGGLPSERPPASGKDNHTAFATYSNICALAMVGCLVRIGLETAMSPSHLGVESSDDVLFKSFISNMVGSTILGILAASTLKDLGGMAPIYTGISTGLCGSITTYAKFNQQVSEMLIGEANPDGNQFFIAFLSLLLGILAPLGCLVFGRDVSMLFRKIIDEPKTSVSTQCKIAKVINYVMGVLFLGCWIALIPVSVVYSDRYDVIFNCISIAFAPFGALLRFFLGKRLNKKDYKRTVMNMIPIGTLAANLTGSLVLAATHVMLAWINFSCPGRAVMAAVGTGFCACLTTVSTMMSEIKGLRDKTEIAYSHLYPLCTIVLCLGLSTLINGVSYAVYLNQSTSVNVTVCP